MKTSALKKQIEESNKKITNCRNRILWINAAFDNYEYNLLQIDGRREKIENFKKKYSKDILPFLKVNIDYQKLKEEYENIKKSIEFVKNKIQEEEVNILQLKLKNLEHENAELTSRLEGRGKNDSKKNLFDNTKLEKRNNAFNSAQKKKKKKKKNYDDSIERVYSLPCEIWLENERLRNRKKQILKNKNDYLELEKLRKIGMSNDDKKGSYSAGKDYFDKTKSSLNAIPIPMGGKGR